MELECKSKRKGLSLQIVLKQTAVQVDQISMREQNKEWVPSQQTSPWQKYRLSSPNLHGKSTNWVSPNLYDIARLSFTKIYKRKAFQNLHDKNQIHLTNVQIQAKRNNKGCVSHTVALPFTLKSILRQKEELWKFKYFTMQKYNLSKHPLKETKILQGTVTL